MLTAKTRQMLRNFTRRGQLSWLYLKMPRQSWARTALTGPEWTDRALKHGSLRSWMEEVLRQETHYCDTLHELTGSHEPPVSIAVWVARLADIEEAINLLEDN